MMEIHPAHRSAPSGLWEAAVTAFGQGGARIAPRALKARRPGRRRISFRTRRARSVTRAPLRFQLSSTAPYIG